jgi:hypothetical protein
VTDLCLGNAEVDLKSRPKLVQQFSSVACGEEFVACGTKVRRRGHELDEMGQASGSRCAMIHHNSRVGNWAAERDRKPDFRGH